MPLEGKPQAQLQLTRVLSTQQFSQLKLIWCIERKGAVCVVWGGGDYNARNTKACLGFGHVRGELCAQPLAAHASRIKADYISFLVFAAYAF